MYDFEFLNVFKHIYYIHLHLHNYLKPNYHFRKETRRNDQKILEIATFLRNQNETFKQALEL